MKLEILKMAESHLAEVFSISKQQFKEESWTFSQFEEELKQNNREDFVLTLGGNVVSFLISIKTDEESNLLYLATQEKYKKQGFATILLGELIEKSKNDKLSYIFLEVKSTNEKAILFYKKNGFNEISKRKNYYKDGSDAVIMFNYL